MKPWLKVMVGMFVLTATSVGSYVAGNTVAVLAIDSVIQGISIRHDDTTTVVSFTAADSPVIAKDQESNAFVVICRAEFHMTYVGVTPSGADDETPNLLMFGCAPDEKKKPVRVPLTTPPHSYSL